MNDQEVIASLRDGTLPEKLMREVEIVPKSAGEGKLELTLTFPEWYHRLIPIESRRQIQSAIMENAQSAYDSSLKC